MEKLNNKELKLIYGGGKILELGSELGEKAGTLWWKVGPTIIIGLLFKKY